MENRKISDGEEKDDDDDDDDEGNGRGLKAWERAYADDISWESLQEDEAGHILIDNQTIYHAQYRRRIRSLYSTTTTARIQKGLIRYLYIVVDLSRVFFSVIYISLLGI